MKRYRLKLTPLTPIHIGTGEEFGPLEYRLRAVRGEQRYEYERFDLNRLMARLARTDRARAERVGELKDLRDVVKEVHDALRDEDILYRADTTPGFADKYGEKLRDVRNQLLVGAMVRDALSGRPTIPGSSLKGAIRTALVSSWGSGARPGGLLEEKGLIGNESPQDDPLRAVRIADATFTGQHADFVGEVFNFSRSKQTGNSMQMIREQIAGVERGNPEAETILDLDDRLMRQRYEDHGEPKRCVSRAVTMEEIAESCRRFYLSRARDEHKRFYRTGSDGAAEADRCYQEMVARLEQAGADTFPVRVGRYSHFESVTVDVFRSVQSRHGASRALSDGLLPMGWLEVQVMRS